MRQLAALLLISCALTSSIYGYTLTRNDGDASWLNHNPKGKSAQPKPQTFNFRNAKTNKFNVDFREAKPSSGGSVADDDKASLTRHAEEAKKFIDDFVLRFSNDKKPSREEVKQAQKESTTAKPVAAATCGYEACDLGKPEMLNVHMVPHTHDDVGWLKTVDEYFYGARNDIQGASVQYILDTVFSELRNDPFKKFIYVEMAFFTRWWGELHDMTKHLVRGLVSTGQLEFTLGGWCMNDEAATHYSSIIDQHTLGFRFLYQNFGECGRPRVGWQIDPFGHSREQASLFAQFGFDGLFFARIDYQDMDQRLMTKTMESVWMGSESLGDQSSLFTGVLYNGYGPPGGFCFECDDAPIMDDERLEDYNVDQRVDDFLNVVNDQAKHYSTNHIMLTMGSDFQYSNARINFKNQDKLIFHVNERQAKGSKVNVIYSTPACYLLALARENQTYSAKTDDFFPYASSDHSFWTGYFTSRPALKGYERTSNNFLQVCKQMDALSMLDATKGSFFKLDELRKAMGILQHHDGVSGTEKQHVAFDYARMVAKGIAGCEEVVSDSFGVLLPLKSGDMVPNVLFCPLTNVSNCPASEKTNQFVVVVYNPLGHNTTHWVRIPVAGGSFNVLDSQMNKVDAQSVPVDTVTASLPDHAGSHAVSELVFQTMLPPLGFNTYFVKAATKAETIKSKSWISAPKPDADIVVKNDYLSATFSGTTGLLKSLTNLANSISIDITQSLMYYRGNNGGSGLEGTDQASGAYVFRPNGTDALPIATTVMTTLVQGEQVQEVHQMFSDWSSQVYRLYKGARFLEVEYTVGHIPVGDNVGKEIISRYETNLDTKMLFYTDANGREIIKRQRDYRATWILKQTEPVAGNYAPVNSRIFIQDVAKNIQLTVLTDRSHGGSSIRDGQLEIMLHRRLLHDDGYGVGEALNEPGLDGKGLYVRGKNYIYLETIAASAMHHRESAQRLFMAPSVGYIQTTMDPKAYSAMYRTMWSGLKMALPANVHLLTLETWHSGYFLLRLEHFYAKDEDSMLSKPATVALKGLFEPFEISEVFETTLGGNQFLNNATRLTWNVQNYGQTTRDMKSFVTPVDPTTLAVVLKPMQIRTFLVVIKENK